MSAMMAIYTVRWEREAAAQNQRQVETQRIRLARVLWFAGEAKRAKKGFRSDRAALRGLFTSPRQAGA